jgi:hypothetical protein
MRLTQKGNRAQNRHRTVTKTVTKIEHKSWGVRAILTAGCLPVWQISPATQIHYVQCRFDG